MTSHDPDLRLRGVDVYYGKSHAIRAVDLDIPPDRITAFIGPSGCGKSTLLRALNRMNDTIADCRVTGDICFRGEDVYGPRVDVSELRRSIGMVFQKPNPFPMSVFDNVAYGLRISGLRDKSALANRVESSLAAASLWDEVRDRLHEPALGLSGGQQQRLCIARALAIEPQVLLMDEPTSALDPIATSHIEALLAGLAERLTIVIVTHNMQQARRVSHETAFFYLGELIESGPTAVLFETPEHERTRAYVSGQFG